MFCVKTLQRPFPFRGYYTGGLVVQIHKIVLIPITLCRGAVLEYLLPIFACCYFFMFLYFLRTIQLLQMKFITNAFGITLTSVKKSPYLLGAILRKFWAHFGVCSSISWKLLRLILWYFVNTLTVNALRKILKHVSLCWRENGGRERCAFYSISRSILNIFFHVLRNVKQYLDILHESLDNMWLSLN